MRRLSCVILSLLMIMSLVSCELGEININFDDIVFNDPNLNIDFSPNVDIEVNDGAEKQEGTSEETKEPDTSESGEGTSKETEEPDTSESGEGTSEETKEPDTSESGEDTSEETKEPDAIESGEGTSEESQDTDESGITETLGDVNNGVLKDAEVKEMDVPSNMKQLGTDNAKEENNSSKINATVAMYTLDGDVVNWFTENDLLYVITSGNNRLVVIDTKTMLPVSNLPLSGKPAEINSVGDKIYISFPNLCRIDIFSKADIVKESSLYFDHEVSSFCLDGDYIYYSEHDQFCQVFRKNLNTGELTTIENEVFYYPKLYLNKEDRILYIGECGHSGSGLYYYDADTLTQKSVFLKNNYGVMNHTREIFHIGDTVFWANYCLSDTNAKELIGQYGVGEYGSVVFASPEIVSTYEGLFLTDTYECIINYFDSKFDFEYVLVSESNNVFFRKRSFDKNIIIGVNFDLQ